MPGEHNVLQRPELIRRLRQFTGIRQRHVTPTLADHIQPVIVVEDISERATERQQIRRAYASITTVGDGVNGLNQGIVNPANSGKQVRIWKARFTIRDAIAAGTAPVDLLFAWSVFTAASTFTFESFGSRRFMHVQGSREYSAGSAPKAFPADRHIPMPVGPIGNVFEFHKPANGPFEIDLPGLILLPDCFFDVDIGDPANAGGPNFYNVSATATLISYYEWTEEDLTP